MLLSICLFFCQLQPVVAYKSLAYKKKARILSLAAPIFWPENRPKNLAVILLDQYLRAFHKFHDVLYRCQRTDCTCYWKFYKSYRSSTCLFGVPSWRASRGEGWTTILQLLSHYVLASFSFCESGVWNSLTFNPFQVKRSFWNFVLY